MAVASRWRKRPVRSNWGDSGEDDQLGRLNLLTPEKVRQDVAEVREGLILCLGLPLDYLSGNVVNPRRLQRMRSKCQCCGEACEVKFDWRNACREPRSCRGEQRANY